MLKNCKTRVARVHDYFSGIEIGTTEANWDQYRLWAEGPSEVCAAKRCLSIETLASLGIDGKTTIFLIE